MRRRALLIALIAVLAVPIAAQVPAGWKVRMDGSPSASAPDANPTLKFAPMAKGFHLTVGPGAIVWDPAHTVKGVFSVKATLTLRVTLLSVTRKYWFRCIPCSSR